MNVSFDIVVVQAAKTLIIMVVLVIGFRLLGKRQMAQLNVYDLAMLMAASNAVQNAMTAGRGNLIVGLATSSTVVVAAWALTRVVLRRQALEPRLVGSPVILVRDGHVLVDRLRRQRVTDEEVAVALRSHGLARPADAELVVLEVDGSFSVVPKAPPA